MENIIFQRTSVRKYTNQSITKEQIEMLLKAGMAAPSAKNVQPWEFIVVQKKETMLKIAEFHPYSSMLKDSPLVIVVCGNESKINIEGIEELWPQDCSAATQNILLEATELGLGGVWLGVYPKKNIMNNLAELLILPKHIIPFSIISIGYPAEEAKPKDKFDHKRIHYEKWSG